MDTNHYIDAESYACKRSAYIKKVIWREKWVLLPIKLLIASALYFYIEHGLLFIVAFILYSLSRLSTDQVTYLYKSNLNMRKSIDTMSRGFSERDSKV